MFNYPKPGFIFLLTFCDASQDSKLKWWNAEHATSLEIEGYGWCLTEIAAYAKLPEKAKENIRKPVWNQDKGILGPIKSYFY
ncbi:hypothetical protein D1614_21735 [Maribellus luteus]|uniref:Uncharacterized protein n=1 Tax=Maribellus luteus TaxID=2305463 RepID=A0A399SPW8_9BACT|nr:hypothetical protein [Maribellus luteus]RIJ45760.1 hypothetical protein D1614_21735 [Maribellus luteus]